MSLTKNVSTSVIYSNLETALNAAAYGAELVVLENCTIDTDITIPSGIMLTIPSSSALDDTIEGVNVAGDVIGGSAYITVEISNGVTLTVRGTLLVAGNQQSTQPDTGCLTGDYGAINLLGSLIVENGGVLYARGKIYGNGTVTVNSGAAVYQLFQIHDWRGGTITMDASIDGINYALTASLYEIANIETSVIYNRGSFLYGQFCVYAHHSYDYTDDEDMVWRTGTATIIYPYNTNTLFVLTDGNILTTFEDGITEWCINGEATLTRIRFDVYANKEEWGDDGNAQAWICSSDSDPWLLSFGYKANLNIVGTLSITYPIKILPSCKITVSGTLVSAYPQYLYGENGFSPDYLFPGIGAASTFRESSQITGDGYIDAFIYDTVNTDGEISVLEHIMQNGTDTYSISVVFYKAPQYTAWVVPIANGVKINRAYDIDLSGTTLIIE